MTDLEKLKETHEERMARLDWTIRMLSIAGPVLVVTAAVILVISIFVLR